MESKKLLEKYRARLVKQGVFKAVILGLIIGFSVLFGLSVIWWLARLNHIWVCSMISLAVMAVSSPIIYLRKFSPPIKRVAVSIDSLGLEERVLTMLEFENDKSFIAFKQREDTKANLKRVNAERIKIAISASLIIALCITVIFGVGAITVAALVDLPEKPETQPAVYNIEYTVQGMGTIITINELGQNLLTPELIKSESADFIIKQKITEGEDAVAVLAVPDTDWVFVGWSDGHINPFRKETAVSKDIKVFASFEYMPGFDDDGEEQEGKGPPAPGDSGGEEQGDTPPDNGNQPNSGPEAGGQYDPNNQVFDGDTYYGGSTYDNAYDSIMDYLRENNVSPEEAKRIEDYLKAIQKQ